MNLVLRAIDGVCAIAAAIAAAALLAVALLGLGELAARALFNYSLPFAIEYASYGLALVLFLGLGWALREGSHIRVTLLLDAVPAGLRRWVDVGATLVALALSVYLSRAMMLYSIRTFDLGTVSFFPSRTPIGYPQIIVAFGALTLSLALLARLIRLLRNDAPERDTAASHPEESM